ncbi:MAG: protein kinase [Betaproteobacteria bacterium]
MNPSIHIAVHYWPRISALLDEALALPAEQRGAWLDALPPEVPDVRATLQNCLARAAEDTSDFMRMPVRLRDIVHEDPAGNAAAQLGTIIGPYRLLREIGTGGMGSVWLAERHDGMLKRRVAVKLPRLHWDIRGLAERMARERDILAALEHPNIARLYDAGVDDQGRPYLAMEYVEGRPLGVYCNECLPDVPQRLTLFLQIARAVAHAHARLVVHRDLKPSNILVTAEGGVRLLDFGVAKLIEGETGKESANETHLTQLAGRALTPDYAAPEQIRGEAITVAVDVYSLGVVLYELLTGHRPYNLETSSPLAMQDALAHLVIPAASTSVPEKHLAHQLRGDLDTILAKALKSAPTERYATVDAFAADVERYLAGMPVHARPDSIGYRTIRFLRRNKLPAAMALLVAFALLGSAVPTAAVTTALAVGAGVAWWQASVARRQAQRAAEEARQAQHERDRVVTLLERNDAAIDFIQVMLTESVAADEKVTLNELLARSESLLLTSVGNQPEQQGAVLDLLASVYNSFGNYAKAEMLLRRAVELVRASSDASLRARIECNHALALSEIGHVEIAQQTIAGWLARNDVEPHVAALCQQYLAQIARNHNDAKGALVNVLGAAERLRASGRKLPDFEASLAGDLAYAYFLDGRIAEADAQYAKSIEMYRAIGREECPAAVAILNNWGIACLGAGDNKRSLALILEVLRIVTKRASNGTAPPYAINNLASVLFSLGRFDESMSAAQRAARIADQAGSRIFWLSAQVTQVSILREQDDIEQAERMLAEVAALAAELPDDSFAVLRYQQERASLALRQDRLPEARKAIDLVVQLFQRRDMCTATLASALRLRAEILWRMGESNAAIHDARDALTIAQNLQGALPHSSFTGLAWLLLARLERHAGNHQVTASSLRHAIDHLSPALGDTHPATILAYELAGSAPHLATTPSAT